MAQLSINNFDIGDGFQTIDQAIALLLDKSANICEIETVNLKNAVGRILASDIISKIKVPAYDNSAVDGYLVYFDDLNSDSDKILPISARIMAGISLEKPMENGTAVRIFTGAAIPDGLLKKPDTIMMQEDCRLSDDDKTVTIMPGIKKFSNYRYAGEDIDIGQVILTAGQTLNATGIGIATSVGISQFSVYKKLRVAVISSGDEIYDPDDKRPNDCLFDANRHMLIAALQHMGFITSDLGILPDCQKAIKNALSAAIKDHDVIITSGGMSVGEEDHMKMAINSLGKMNFWRLAIKPGRPVGFGHIKTNITTATGTVEKEISILGLPGNPVAAITTLMIIGKPLLTRLSGGQYIPPKSYKIYADFTHKKKQGIREYLRAKLKINDNGEMTVVRYGKSGAAMLTSMVGADGFLILPEDLTKVNIGDMLDFLPFNEIL